MKIFGKRLRTLREARSWSQEKLGFELGVTKATISKWESGQMQPGLHTLLKIKKLFGKEGISLDFLGDGDGETSAPAAGGVMETPGVYEHDPRIARSPTELQMLLRFRELGRKRQKALLGLLTESE